MNNHEQIDRKIRSMNWWRFALLMIARKPANEMFHVVIGRACERGMINSHQMHEVCGIWNRMVNGL